HEEVFRNVVELVAAQLCFKMNQFLYLHEKPFVDIGGLSNGFERHAQFKCILDMEEAIAAWMFKAMHNLFQIAALPPIGAQSTAAKFQALIGFLQCFDKCAPDSHLLAHGFHLQDKFPVCSHEISKIPAVDLYNHIVQSRIKIG